MITFRIPLVIFYVQKPVIRHTRFNFFDLTHRAITKDVLNKCHFKDNDWNEGAVTPVGKEGKSRSWTEREAAQPHLRKASARSGNPRFYLQS